MSKLNKQRRTPLNYPDDGNAFSMMLEAMSTDELTEALHDALQNITEENYDPALIDAYLDALDRKDPMPELPDAEASYAGFQMRIRRIFPERRDKKAAPRYRRVWRIGLVAVLTIICMLGGMIVAQAAGLNIFGVMASWTNSVFSFGEIRSDGAADNPNKAMYVFDGNDSEAAFTSLQEALDAYGITEVSEPAWFPEGYILDRIDTLCMPDGTLWHLSAEYTNGSAPLHIVIDSYWDEPISQIEKTDAPVENFVVNDNIVYLLENTNDNSAAWVTEHYECFIGGAVEKNELRQMVLSAYADIK
ncbi:MAG: hypothetical protein K2O18_15230 [Oscillospiraceae bacterium]|nr:hypothetical protein [Oscillospiraceae bacterium]